MSSSPPSVAPVVLVADASESAGSSWPRTAKTVADLIEGLSPEAVGGVYLLGTRLRWPPDEWRPDLPQPPAARASGSFVAPVMAAMRAAQFRPRAMIVVGTGQVFDLDDWVAEVPGWYLVRTGGASLQGSDGNLPEVAADAMERLYDALRLAQPSPTSPYRQRLSGFLKHEWDLDRCGYPLVLVPPLGAYVHLFPMAKPQLEHFLAIARLSAYGDGWYGDLLKVSPRLSAMAASLADYERVFATGLLPAEVEEYTRWHGQGFGLPTAQEWQNAYRWMQGQDEAVPPSSLERDMNPTAARLWAGLLAELRPRTLLDLSLMCGGVVEWVRGPGGAPVGLGQPRPAFYPSFRDPLRGEFFEPTSLTRRSRLYGFRLVRRM